MGFLRSRPKEVRAALGILDEIDCSLDPKGRVKYPVDSFALIRKEIEDEILKDQKDFVYMVVKEGAPPRGLVWSMVAKVSGDLLESGRYHLGPGFLNPMGPGEGLLALFDMSQDELVKIGCWSGEKGEQQKRVLRSNIADLG